jgi:osmoprotectant transport system ATP-binding protein
MLMDEPFAALDTITRRRLQDQLLAIQNKVRKTILFVTHDVEEAIRLADRIAVMRAGRIVQYDTPFNIISHPADEFVADLVGANDVLRRLSLIPAHAVAEPITHDPPRPWGPTLPADASLRDALGLLLTGTAERVLVLDEAARPCGTVDLHIIRRVSYQSPVAGGHKSEPSAHQDRPGHN